MGLLSTCRHCAIEPLHHTTALPRGSGPWNSHHNALHCLGGVGCGLQPHTTALHWGNGQWNSCNTLRQRLWALGNEPLQYIVALSGASE